MTDDPPFRVVQGSEWLPAPLEVLEARDADDDTTFCHYIVVLKDSEVERIAQRVVELLREQQE
jgi:hypothetical protein